MILAQEIKTFLDIIGSLGTLKIGTMPETPDAIGCIYEYGGKMADNRFGIAGIGYENPAFQLVFRGDPNDYLGPRQKCEIAWKALETVQPGALCSGVTTNYLRIKARQSPFMIERADLNRRIKIGCNFYAMKEPS